MTRPRSALALFATLLLAATIGPGCDPKITSSGGGPGGGDDDNEPPPGVTTSAGAVGSVVALYVDLLQAALSQSSSYAGTGTVRSVFTSECITIDEIPAEDPVFEIRVDGCVDGRGTEYRGGVALLPIDGFDGYYLWPFGAAEDRIIATNAGESDYNHTYDQGNLQLIFVRNGSDNVTAVEVKNFVRHVLKTKTATFSFDGVFFNGDVGSHADYPRSGGVIHLAWDTVGVFDVEFGGSSVATFSVQGFQYQVNLSNGSVSLL